MTADAGADAGASAADAIVAACTADADIAGSDARRLQRCRTQRLFDLAVTASSCDPRRIARSMRIDIRSLRDMRDMPSIGYIARIARILGIEPSSAADVVGLERPDILLQEGRADPAADAMAPTGRTRARLFAMVRDADIDDDERMLDGLAASLARSAQTPGDLALSLLCTARACAARGEVGQAVDCARFAESIGFDEDAGALASELAACIELEAALGEPWSAQSAKSVPASTAGALLCAAWLAPKPGRDDGVSADASGRRRRAARLALDLVDRRRWQRIGPVQCLAALGESVAEAEGSGCARSLAWTASIGAAAALRVLELADIPETVGRRAMQLFVRNQLAVDQRIAVDGMSASCVLHRRRLRMLLYEWHDRIRRGEADAALLDEAERHEIKAMSARFPRASCARTTDAI